MSISALAQAAGSLIQGLPVRPLLGGVDESGGHVYELDGSGTVIEDAASGMQLAYGVLEDRIETDTTVESISEVVTGAA